MLNVLILAAGGGETDAAGRSFPACLSEVDGVSILERVTRNAKKLKDATVVFAFVDSDARRFHLEKIARLLIPSSRTICVPAATKGSACTALLAASQLAAEAELLIISANELVEVDISEALRSFRLRALDAGTFVFRSVHPRYSYVRLDSDGYVVESAQRVPISSNATAGIFWFSRTALFVDAAKSMIRKDAQTDGAYFVAPTFNELVLQQMRIGVSAVSPGEYLPLKDDIQLRSYAREPRR